MDKKILLTVTATKMLYRLSVHYFFIFQTTKIHKTLLCDQLQKAAVLIITVLFLFVRILVFFGRLVLC